MTLSPWIKQKYLVIIFILDMTKSAGTHYGSIKMMYGTFTHDKCIHKLPPPSPNSTRISSPLSIPLSSLEDFHSSILYKTKNINQISKNLLLDMYWQIISRVIIP